jgi:hypothetical protein
VGEPVTLRATVVNGGSAALTWAFGDGGRATGTEVTHSWSSAKTYQVSVQAVRTDGQRGSASASITIMDRPKLTLKIAKGAGSITGGGVSCSSAACVLSVDWGQTIGLTAEPGAYYTLESWGGSCRSTGTCTVIMDQDRTVTAAFTNTVTPTAEDCAGHDPTRLTIEKSDDGYRLIDSGNHLMTTLATLRDAENAKSVASGYTSRCFVGRPNDYSMQYWKGGTGRPGPVTGERCTSYDPTALTLASWSTSQLMLTDGTAQLELFDSEADGVRGLRVAEQYSRRCTIGAAPNVVKYWR